MSLDPPVAAWMYKPRSKAVNDKEEKGALSSGFAMLGSMAGNIRNMASQSWNKRYVCVSDNAVCYGEKMGQKDKVIPFETIQGASVATKDQLKTMKAPDNLLDFGWLLTLGDKETYFCCESEATRNEWVQYCQQLLASMTTSRAQAGDSMMSKMLDNNEADDRTQAADDDDGPGDLSGTKSMKELQKLAGGAIDDDGDFNLADDEEDEEDDEDDDDDVAEDDSPANGGVQAVESKDKKLQRLLLPKAETPYAHINTYKIEEYKEFFKKDDSIKNIRFSRAIIKVAKRDNAQERDLIITNKYIYLFHKGTFTKTNVRAIEMDQLVGVVESLVESNLVALIVPSFHDILVRITPQNSLIGGSEVDVKYQLIAHLYAAQRALNTGRQFIFRETENVRAVIRRWDGDQHLPLESRKEDKLGAATNSELYPAFRTNADSIVYWSSMVMRINAERVSLLRGFVITDAAFYVTSENVKNIVRRTALSEVTKILFDSDTMMLLIKCTEVDALFSIKDQNDFQNVQRTILRVAGEANHVIKCTPSHQLFSHCQLVETRKLLEMFGSANPNDSLKKGMRLTQKLLRNSWKVSIKGVTTIGSSVEKGFDVLKSATKEVGGVLVNNAISGNLLAAGNLFLSQHRFVQERIIEYEDEDAVLALAKEPYPDSYKLNGSQQATDLRMGTVGFSSHCDKYNLTATLDAARTSGKIIAVCNTGIYLFDAPGSSGGLLKGLLQFGNALKQDEFIEWKNMKSIVQCDKEPNVIGLVTGGVNSDIMIRAPNGILTNKLISVAAAFYLKTTNSKRYARSMLKLYDVPTTENLKSALRKTVFDPPATIALRHAKTGASSDQLMLAVVEDVAETVRRYGDNTLLFSSLAWRFRNTTSTKHGKMDELLKDDDSKNNAKLFKSFIAIVTNGAFYQCAKGGYNIVRRIELRDISCIRVSKEDPDTMLLVIPTDLDLLFRVDGRGRELMSCLKDAYNAWTLFGLYLIKDEPNSHAVEDYCFPTVLCDQLVQSGNLERADGDTPEHSAAQTFADYQDWFQRDLDVHLQRFNAAVDASENGLLLSEDNLAVRGVAVDERKGGVRWEHVMQSLDNCFRAVKFSHARAFRFGIRGNSMTQMTSAGMLLIEWQAIVSLAESLIAAVAEEEILKYESLREEASSYAALSFLIREQEHLYQDMSKKKIVILAIEDMLNDESRRLVDMEDELSRCFDDAVATKVKESTLMNFRHVAEARMQKEKLATRLKQLFASGEWVSFPSSTKALYIDAAGRLKVDANLIQQLSGSRSKADGSKGAAVSSPEDRQEDLINALITALDGSIRTSNAKSITNTVATTERMILTFSKGVAAPAALAKLTTTVAFATKQLSVLAANSEHIRELQAIRLQVKRSHFGLPKEELVECRKKLSQLSKIFDPSNPVLEPHIAIAFMHLKRIDDELFQQDEQTVLSKKEARAMAEYAEQQKQRALDEKSAQEALAREEEMKAVHRRLEQVASWTTRAQKLCISFDHAIKSGDVSFTRQCLRNCAVFSEEVKEAFKQYPESGQKIHKDAMDKALGMLQASAKLGQTVLERAVGGEAANESGEVSIPPQLQRIIDHHEKANLVSYIQGHQDTLNRATIAEVRARWLASAKKHEWVSTLHKSIHTAFALNSIQLLQAQVDLARSNSYVDDVVVGASDVLNVMIKAEAEKSDGNTNGEAAGGSQETVSKAPAAAAPAPAPKPTITTLTQVYPGATHPVQRLHAAIVELLNDPSNTSSAADKKKIRVVDESSSLRLVVNEWIAVMQHKAKPSGVFRKTERNIIDVIEAVAHMTRSGDFLAPYTNRVLSDFDRVKKFNNPQGHSGGYFMVQFMLIKGDLEIVLSELGRLLSKDISDVYLEDSIMRNPACSRDILICSTMCSQIEWPFVIHEKSALAPLAELGGSMSPPRGGAADSAIGSPTGSSAAGDLPPAEARRQNALRAVVGLRRAVQTMSQYFANSLKQLGCVPTPVAMQALFDENTHKGVGLIVREHLCPALSLVLLGGFRSSHFLKKRHLWDLVTALAVRLRESSKELDSVGIPDAVDMVLSITDITGRNKQSLSRLTEDKLSDIRWRMFVCHCLNQKILKAFFDSLFDDGAVEFLNKFYRVELCLLVPVEDEVAVETKKVLHYLSAIPYILCIDAEVW